MESTLAGRWWSYTACRVPPTTPQAGGAEETILVPGLDLDLDLDLGLVRDLGQGLVRTLVQGLGPVLVPTPSTPIESPTAVTYCPDQCTPQGCTSSQCSPPTCSMEGMDHQAGDSWTVQGTSGILPRTKVEARAPGATVEEVEEGCGQVCTCRAEFVSENPLRVGGVVECRAAPCDPPTTCSHRGRSYPVGAFQDGCNSCSCAEFGEVTCTEKACTGGGAIPGVSPRGKPSKINFQ